MMLSRTDDKTHYSERGYGSFALAFALPSDADRKGISANFAKDVLTVRIPKSANGHERAKEIEIKPS
jgi:HSP20 family protein